MANVSDAIVAAVERATQLIKDWAIPKNHGIGNKGKYLKVNDDGSTGYADTPGGSETGHTHANKAVLDSITTHNLVDYTGYKINILGDSIVTGKDGAVSSGNVTKTITDIIAEKLGCTVRNYGWNGSTLGGDGSAVGQYTYLSRYSAMDDDANMIVVFGGTNDYGLNKCVPVGKIGDTTNATFYGSLDILIKGLIAKYPSAELRFITPIRRSTTSANTHGNTLDQYAKAMIEVCRKHSVPCYDAYNGFEVHVADAAWKTANLPDGLHPTQAFYYQVADMVQDAILNRPCAGVDYGDAIVSLNANLGTKLNKSGHQANKYLGTDADGNIVPKDAPAGGNTTTTIENPYTLPVATSTTLGGVKGKNKTSNDTVEVAVDSSGKMYVPTYPTNTNTTTTVENPYTLPVASATVLGGIKADTKTDSDTVPVHVDADGRLWVERGGTLDIAQIASQLDLQSNVDEAGDLTFTIVAKGGVV